MGFEKIRKDLTREFNEKLVAELRRIGVGVGNMDFYPISEKMLDDFGNKIYQKALSDAAKVFEKCSEKFDEEIYLLEQDARRRS